MTEGEMTSTQQVSDVKPARLFQYFTALAVTIGALSFGTSMGYMSPAGPALRNGTMTEDELMWFSSTLNVGAMMGGPVGGLLINVLGRRGTMMASLVLNYGGWALIALGQNFATLISGRIITGVFAGVTCLVVNTYIGEVTSADIRGMLASGFQVMAVTGMLYGYVFGAVVPGWRNLAWACLAPTVIYTILLFFIKESPVFLYQKGKEKEAREAMQALRGKHYNIEPEFRILRKTQDLLRSSKTTFRDMLKPHILKPLGISLAIMFFQQSNGVNACIFNLNLIFMEAGTDIDENISSILVGTLMVLATIVSLFLMDRAGRKILLIVSGAVMTVSISCLGAFFYMRDVNGSAPGWLPLASLSVFIIFFSVGYGPIPWILMGELFSVDVRAQASGVATLTNWGFSFLVTLTYDPMKFVMHEYGIFWLYGGMCVINVLFCVFVVPETKGKTIEEITAHFGGPVVPDVETHTHQLGSVQDSTPGLQG